MEPQDEAANDFPSLKATNTAIYIESRCEHTSKPAVWYQLDKKGLKRRFTRNPLGIRVEQLDARPFLLLVAVISDDILRRFAENKLFNLRKSAENIEALSLDAL